MMALEQPTIISSNHKIGKDKYPTEVHIPNKTTQRHNCIFMSLLLRYFTMKYNHPMKREQPKMPICPNRVKAIPEPLDAPKPIPKP